MYAGLDECSPAENEVLVRLGLRHTGSRELAAGSSSILNWTAQEDIGHLAVHFDVDAMRPQSFRRFYSTSLMLERASFQAFHADALSPIMLCSFSRTLQGLVTSLDSPSQNTCPGMPSKRGGC
jgi:hypothetical protein